MNLREKKKVLTKYRDLDRRIERDAEALIRLREQATRVTPILSLASFLAFLSLGSRVSPPV